MSDRQNQQEVWGTAGRAAALLLSLVMFTAIWESDSQRSKPEQIAGDVEAPAGTAAPSVEQPIDFGSIELDRTVRRNNGLVRVRLQLQSVSEQNQPELNSELVFRGDVSHLRSKLVSLLEELDTTAQILPASAEQADQAKAAETVPVPEPRDFTGDAASEVTAPIATEPVTTRGFIFLGRQPPMSDAVERDSVPTDKSKAERRPRLLNWSALPRRSTRLR